MAKRSVVMNLGDKEYVEKFHDKEYRIPAKGEITLSRHEAIEFMGNYAGLDVIKPLKIRHLDSGETEQGFVCNLCGKVFPTSKSLEAHMEKDHENSATTKKVFTCTFCQAKATSRTELYKHMESHKDKKANEILEALSKAG